MRLQAIHAAKKLHPSAKLASDIEVCIQKCFFFKKNKLVICYLLTPWFLLQQYALQSLKKLLNEKPPNLGN